MKQVFFLLYAWGTTILFVGLIFWLSTIPGLHEVTDDSIDTAFKTLFKMTQYAVLFILIYRSIILTLKTTVDRLMSWRSKEEHIEDLEFMLIIESLVTLVTALLAIIVAIVDEYIQATELVEDTRAEGFRGVLVSSMAIFLTSVVVYSLPVLGELEIAIKHKIEEGFKA